MRGKFQYGLLFVLEERKKVKISALAKATGLNDATLYRYKGQIYPKARKEANSIIEKLDKELGK